MTIIAAPVPSAHALVLPLSGLSLWSAQLDGSAAVELRTPHGELLGVLRTTATTGLRVGIAVAREAAGDRRGWTVAAGSAPVGLTVDVGFHSLHVPVAARGEERRTASRALRIGPWWFAETIGILPVVVATAPDSVAVDSVAVDLTPSGPPRSS